MVRLNYHHSCVNVRSDDKGSFTTSYHTVCYLSVRKAGLLLTLSGTPPELPRGPLQVPGPQGTGQGVFFFFHYFLRKLAEIFIIRYMTFKLILPFNIAIRAKCKLKSQTELFRVFRSPPPLSANNGMLPPSSGLHRAAAVFSLSLQTGSVWAGNTHVIHGTPERRGALSVSEPVARVSHLPIL